MEGFFEERGRELEPGEVVTVTTSEPCHIGGRYRFADTMFSFVVADPKPGRGPMYMPWYFEEHMRAERIPDAHSPRVTPAGTDMGAPDDVKVRQALTCLEHDNDEHWTRTGLPAVGVVDSLAGDIGVTRDMIHNAQPGFVRQGD